MFDVQVGPSTYADFPTLADAMKHYERFPWWKRWLTRLFRAYVTVEAGTYPDSCSMPLGVYILIGIGQSATFTITGGSLEFHR